MDIARGPSEEFCRIRRDDALEPQLDLGIPWPPRVRPQPLPIAVGLHGLDGKGEFVDAVLRRDRRKSIAERQNEAPYTIGRDPVAGALGLDQVSG
jgi:hypothetical protein